MKKFFSWFAKWLGITPLDFWFPQKANPLVEEHDRAMRYAWTLAAAELNLGYSRGKELYEDKITGMLDGFRIAIFNESNFDIQRLVTAIRVFSEGKLPSSENDDLDSPNYWLLMTILFEQTVQCRKAPFPMRCAIGFLVTAMVVPVRKSKKAI